VLLPAESFPIRGGNRFTTIIADKKGGRRLAASSRREIFLPAEKEEDFDGDRVVPLRG